MDPSLYEFYVRFINCTWGSMCHGTRGVRGQLGGVGFLLVVGGSWGLTCHQAIAKGLCPLGHLVSPQISFSIS